MALSNAERKRAYRRRQKIAKYGEAVADVDMRGRHGNQARGEKNGRWNSGKLISSHGYVLIRVSKDHPRAFGNGYAYEHDLVMEAELGRHLLPNEIVHHENENKQDNRPKNLEIKLADEHMREHYQERDIDAQGRFVRKGGALRIREYPA